MEPFKEPCEFIRGVAEGLANMLRNYFGLDEYSRVVGTGVSGDYTRCIDVVAEEYVVNAVKRAGLPAWVISEERGLWALCERPSYILLLDPLDGSLNYALKIPFASVSIALYSASKKINEPTCGMVLNVFTGDRVEVYEDRVLFNGTVVPAYLNRGFEVVSIYTEDSKHLDLVFKCLKERGVPVKTRTMGSAAIESAYAAIGLIGHFIHLTGRIRNTDIAVSLAVASKMGIGAYTDPPVNEIEISRVESIKKVLLAPKTSPIWRVLDRL